MPCPRISAGSIHRVPSSPTYDEAGNRERIAHLAASGVDVWGPERVYIAADVSLGNIEAGTSLINVNLSGADTRVGRGSRIGLSGLARVENCQIGPRPLSHHAPVVQPQA